MHEQLRASLGGSAADPALYGGVLSGKQSHDAMSEEETLWEFISEGAPTITRDRFERDARRCGVSFSSLELDCFFGTKQEITFEHFRNFCRM